LHQGQRARIIKKPFDFQWISFKERPLGAKSKLIFAVGEIKNGLEDRLEGIFDQ
jgi:hypothetical protein